MAEVSLRLSDDHKAVGEVLNQLLVALNNKDIEKSHAKLDLLWARLAVHIRAEHLHLFPAVTKWSSDSLGGDVPALNEVQTLLENLKADHDFFMRALAGAIGILRELPKQIVKANDEASFATVCNVVREVEKRLAAHNEIEETQIYRWSNTVGESVRMNLIAEINAELENHPPRFSLETWTNSL